MEHRFNARILIFLYGKLFFLFADIICLFADNMGGLEKMMIDIKIYIAMHSALNMFKKVRL